MNELVSVPISPWYTIPAAVGLLTLTFVFAPGVLLHLGVLIYPKGHDRRKEFTAELYTVPYLKRPFWVASTLVRCLFEGTLARIQSIRSPRAARRRRTFAKYPTRWLLVMERRDLKRIERHRRGSEPWKTWYPSVASSSRLRRLRQELQRRSEG